MKKTDSHILCQLKPVLIHKEGVVFPSKLDVKMTLLVFDATCSSKFSNESKRTQDFPPL